MKKFTLLLCLLFSVSIAWAEDLQLTEENFLSWVKAQKIDGFKVDEESLENYDDREFTIDFMATGSPTYLSIQVSSRGALAELKTESQKKNNKAVAEYSEINIDDNKAAYYTLSTMKNVSFMNVELPKIGGELRLTTSPKKSADEMRAILTKFNLKGLK